MRWGPGAGAAPLEAARFHFFKELFCIKTEWLIASGVYDPDVYATKRSRWILLFYLSLKSNLSKVWTFGTLLWACILQGCWCLGANYTAADYILEWNFDFVNICYILCPQQFV